MTVTVDMIPVWQGRIERGRIILDDEQGYADLKRLLDNKRIELTLKEHIPGRSVSANRYYWKVPVKILAEHTGATTLETHQEFKRRLLLEREDASMPFVTSTKKMNAAEFSRYVEGCIRICAEQGVIIPEARRVVPN